jgi:hypothetical protein
MTIKGKRPLGRLRGRWVNNITMNFGKKKSGTYWIDLADDTDRERPLLNTVMNIRVLEMLRNS